MKSFLKVLAITTIIFNCGIRGNQQELWDALQEGSYWKVKKAVEHGASVTEPLEDGTTPLLQALETENSKIVLYLLDHGAESTLNTPNNSGLYPLMRALVLDKSTIRILLERGAIKSINTVSRGETALSFAVRLNKEDIVLLLLEYGAEKSINVPNNHNERPLLRAVKVNNVNIVKILLAHGGATFINSASNRHVTPLFCACCSDRHKMKVEFSEGEKPNIDIVRALLEHGAAQSLDISNGGYDPMIVAVHSGNLNVVQLLLDYGAAQYMLKNAQGRSDIIVCAIDRKDLSLVHLVCELGASELINNKNCRGKTPLFYAVLGANADIISYLLEHGAAPSLSIFCTDKSLIQFTGTPLEYALFCQQHYYHESPKIAEVISVLTEWSEKTIATSEAPH